MQRMMKMNVIRTSVRRKLMRASLPFILTAVSASAAVYAGTFVVPAAVQEKSPIYNMNGFVHVPEKEPDIITETMNTDIAEEAVNIPEPIVQPENDTETQKNYLMTLNKSNEHEDLSLFTSHSGMIYEETFGRGSGPEYIEIAAGAQVRNCTDIDADTVVRNISGKKDIAVEMYSDEPQVLIIHTHTSESYEPYTKDWYDERYTSRSLDPENGVTAVGEAISESLAKEGISVIHDCTIHDAMYNGAYSRSLDTVLDIMSEYPSIKIVLDIHRDAIEYEDQADRRHRRQKGGAGDDNLCCR